MALRLPLHSALLALLPTLVSAAPSGTLPGEVVITASRLETAPASTPYSVSVLAGATLAGRADVADALSDLAEIHVQTPGGRSGAASIFLRGADPNFTAVLFDGVPLNNPTDSRGGAVNVAAISASSLERIELVTGPLSSLYGSGSLAGVINLVAPAGRAEHQLQGAVALGTRGYGSVAARWRGPLAAGLGFSAGVTADDDGEQTPGAQFRSKAFTAKIAPLDREDAGRLILRLGETDAMTYPDSSGGPRLATRTRLESRHGREQLLGLTAPVLRRGATRLDLAASLLERRDDTTSPGVAPSAIDPVGIPAGTDRSTYRRVAGQATGRWDIATWTLGAGLEALRESGRSSGKLDFGRFQAANSFYLQRSATSAFVEAQRSGARWSFNTGLRADAMDGLKSRVTARAGVRYRIPGRGFALRAAAGSGFKAPSFYAVGNPFVGNPKLRPESSVGGELGLQWMGAAGSGAAVTLFRTRFSDLIDFVPGPPPRLENRNLVVSQGVALTATQAFTPRLSASLQAQYARTRDGDTGESLLNRPQWRLNASVGWRPVDALAVTLRYRQVGERDDYAIPVGVRSLGAYGVASAEAAWTLRTATTARVVIDNAFDSTHDDALGFPAARASARLLLTHTLD